jgi:hypothetical protein
VGIRCTDHATPFYPEKSALTSPAIGGCSVGIVRLQTEATEFVLFCMLLKEDIYNKRDTQEKEVNLFLNLNN